MSSTPHVELCATARHLEECGECADAIGRIVKEEVAVLAEQSAVPEATEEKPRHFDAAGVELSGLMTSHADVANAADHPVEYGEKCGICIARKRRAQDRGGAAAVISALDRL